MQKYRLPIAAVVLVLLAGAVYAVLHARSEGTQTAEAPKEPKLPDINKDQVDSIEIQRHGEETIRLAKQGTTWKVVAPLEAPVEDSAIRTALDTLDDLEHVSTAATKAANHARLEVDAEKGVRVIVKHGNELLANLIIGAYKGGNTMVRVEGEELVHAARGSIKYAFNKPLKDWRERSIVDVQPDSVTALTLEANGHRMSFTKNGEDWGLGAGTKIERFAPSKVRSLVSSLAHLRAADFADRTTTREQAGINDTAARATLTLGGDAGPQQIVVRFGNAHGTTNSEYYAAKDGDDVLYIVSKFVVDRVKGEPAGFQTPLDAGTAANDTEPHGGDEMPEGMGGMGMPPGMNGMMGGGGQNIPPEVMQKIQQQLRQRGMQGAPH